MEQSCCAPKGAPKKLAFSFLDYFRSLYCWIFSFKKTYSVKPGLYFTGEEYDINAPVLVTCNYHLTVFLLWRIIKKLKTRILIIDTKGINVWCSSGKGQFCANEILKVISAYEPGILTKGKKIELILPKLSLSGVSLSELKKNFIKPIIGPVYMKSIPKYLKNEPYEDCADDKYKFNLKDRLFTLVPSSLQFMKYIFNICLAIFVFNHFRPIGIYWQPFILGLLICLLYIIIFPILPSKKFAVKGIFLASIILFPSFALDRLAVINLALLDKIFYSLFILGTSVWFGLYYTGSSGVSSYSLVKKEITMFLPVAFLAILSSLVILIIKGFVN